MQPLISVIIPLYNGEKYIVKCLDSVLEQPYEPLEIIVVDDASPDDSVKVIEEYGKDRGILVEHMQVEAEEETKVPENLGDANGGMSENWSVNEKQECGHRIKIVHQKNQGQGAARNTGIQVAKGVYLAFLDQDDWMEPGILVKMAEQAEAEQADLVSAGYRRVTTEGKIKQEVHLQHTGWSKYKSIAPWSKLYRTAFIKENQVMFLPVVLGEDIYFLMQAFSYKPEVIFLQEVGYNWLDNAVSVSNTAHKELAEDTSLLKLYDMLEDLSNVSVLKQDKLYEYFLLKTAIWDILYTARTNTYEKVAGNSQAIWEWFARHMVGYEKNPYISLGKPRGESAPIRFVVWTYMKLKKWKLEKLFLRVLSK